MLQFFRFSENNPKRNGYKTDHNHPPTPIQSTKIQNSTTGKCVKWASRKAGTGRYPPLYSWWCCGLITLGECVHLSLACHCWDYTPQTCGNTAPVLLIQSLIKISCKSLRQMQSQAAIGLINTQSERSSSAAGESSRDGMKCDLGPVDEGRTSQSSSLT